MNPKITLSWDYEPVKYEHFTDLGNYFIQMNDANVADFTTVNQMLEASYDSFAPACTCTVKRNSKGEVIVGRNMDIEISQNPAYITLVHGGKYEVVNFAYAGVGNKYRYDQCTEADADEGFCASIPFNSTDAMNEAGLYVEADLREMDLGFHMECPGTNPGKERVSVMSVALLVALNCATVPEAVEYLRNSYDWHGLTAPFEGEITTMNFAFIMGDALGNYGLVEFAMNKIFYTPYANGQANYYVHPAIAEYAADGCGFGRLAAALEGLPACETELDMMHNMEACMWRREILEIGSLGYSDFKTDVNDRRAMSEQELHDGFAEQLAPVKPLAEAFYAGDEKPLRDSGAVWTTSFNFGVNCATKHLMLRLWENSDLIVDVQW